MQGLFDEYKATLQDDRRRLLEGYRFVDIARKIVGVGSVGTRCWILLLEGRTHRAGSAVPAVQGGAALRARGASSATASSRTTAAAWSRDSA